ncbi:MAG: methylated-DNA--[protein]-cysteine S-methyltransferase [Thermoplasmatota archaeon]
MEGEVGTYVIGSPIGNLLVQFSPRGLRSLSLIGDARDGGEFSGLRDENASDELAAVKTFVGDLFFCRDPGLSGLKLDMEGISDFRKRVYTELRKVPFGDVITYGELARRAGSPGGARAVGQAMNSNPFLLVVPCHRVVASKGNAKYALGGFGAGLDVKRVLLHLEGHHKEEITGL